MKPRVSSIAGCLLLALVALVADTAAQAQSVSLVDLNCVPRKGNGVVRASVIPDPAVGQSPRVYFRSKNHAPSPFYWAPLEVEPNSQYWSVFPRPEAKNNEVEYYVAVVDAAGKVVTRSDTKVTPVRNDCQAQLNPREQGVAENLIVGETSPDQKGKMVSGFLCPGLKIRIDYQGVRRADEKCGPCGLAWLPAASLAGAGLVGVIVTDDPKASPSTP